MEPTGAQTNRREMLFVYIVPGASCRIGRLTSSFRRPLASLKRCADGIGNDRLWVPIRGADIEIATGDRR